MVSQKKLYTFCHSGLDPESSVFGLDFRFRGNDNFWMIVEPWEKGGVAQSGYDKLED